MVQADLALRAEARVWPSKRSHDHLHWGPPIYGNYRMSPISANKFQPEQPVLEQQYTSSVGLVQLNPPAGPGLRV